MLLVGLEDAVANARRLLDAARAHDGLIVPIRHETPGASADAPFAPGTPPVDIIAEAVPKAGEAVVVKHHPNAFRDTDLKRRLDEAGVTEVVIVGAMSHRCIDATAPPSILGIESRSFLTPAPP